MVSLGFRSVGLLACLAIAAPACRDGAAVPSADAGAAAPTASASAPTATATATARAATSSASRSSVFATGGVPTLTTVRVAPEGSEPRGVFAVEGGVVVADATRVGLVKGDAVEWAPPPAKARVPDDAGTTSIFRVFGAWPDGIVALFASETASAPSLTLQAMTGSGAGAMLYGLQGSGAHVAGVADSNGTTFLARNDVFDGTTLFALRGPKVDRRPQTQKEARCVLDELRLKPSGTMPAAIEPVQFGSTRSGTLVSVGPYCDNKGVAAEVWGSTGSSTIVDLTQWVKKAGSDGSLVRAGGDKLLYFSGNGDDLLLVFDMGAFAPLPRLERPVKGAFVTPDGRVHATDGATLYGFDGKAWVVEALLQWPGRWRQWASDGTSIWASSKPVDETQAPDARVFELRPAPPLTYTDDCKTPFVHIHDVSPGVDPSFTFPTTRHALMGFQGPNLDLVEVTEGGVRRVGAVVLNRGQGDLLVGHVRATLREDAHLICYDPKDGRKIPVASK